MKRQALAAMIASLFALAACGGEPAAQAPAETPAASAEAASSAAQATAETPAGEL
ncbi:TPA: nitrite reductase, copper-containing, partial [Neisseria gonorrhoeae]